MDTRLAHCPGCGRQVRLAWTSGPEHLGHANVPDGPELVCLDACGCEGGACHFAAVPPVVMTVRLARSGMNPDHFPHARFRCGGCEAEAEMEVLGGSMARCTVCGTINRWIVDDLVEHGVADVGGAGAQAD
jgi:hypothetical protein